ncbi:MAG: protein-tyrosine-phosphatase [Alphaproteobacteria bacterium]|nr:protein-tyrosine-phosphatase [Alphaproteobacteria bacterium]
MSDSTATAGPDAGLDTVQPALLPYRLTICGLEELPTAMAAGVSHVISILDPDIPEPAVLQGVLPSDRVTWRFDDIIRTLPGYAAPEARDVERIVEHGTRLRGETVSHLLVHCHAGVSRSTAAAAILMCQDKPGREEDAFAAIRRIRPRSWPNSRMIAFADTLLGRGGAFKAALARHLEHIARDHPDLAELVRLHGRAHEVPGIAQGPALATAGE